MNTLTNFTRQPITSQNSFKNKLFFSSPDESLDLIGVVGPDEGLFDEEVDGHGVDQDVSQRLQPQFPPKIVK